MKAISAQILGFALMATAFAQDFESCSPDEHLMDPPECPPFEQIPTYFPYPYDCTKYFECTNGDARCIQCAPGTRWDQELKTCNHEHAIECVVVTTSKPTTTTTTTTEPTTTTTTTTTEPTTTTTTTEPTTPSTSSTTEDPAEWICPEGYLGPIGHPYDCTHFYVCDPGRRRLMVFTGVPLPKTASGHMMFPLAKVAHHLHLPAHAHLSITGTSSVFTSLF